MEELNTEFLLGFNYLYGKALAEAKEVLRACEHMLEQAGFEEIRPPVIVDYAHIVGETDRPVAPSKADLIFSLQAADGEQRQRLALSYENTVPVCVFYIRNFADTPSWLARRFFYISAHFRNENETEITASHRLRQFHQVGYEVIGGVPPETLPVAIGTGSDLLTGLGLNHAVRISDVVILSSVFNRLGLGEGERSALRFLYDRGNTRAFESFLAQSGLDTRQKALLARLFFSRCSTPLDLGELKYLLREHELEDAFTRIERINDVLGALPPGIRRLAALDLSLVRSARMYSGVIFQYYLEGADRECGGGGEYNRLVKSLGGPDTSACGAAFGLERVIHAARNNLPSQAEVLGKAAGR
jgi:histidyl-tRNA synthetase